MADAEAMAEISAVPKPLPVLLEFSSPSTRLIVIVPETLNSSACWANGFTSIVASVTEEILPTRNVC
jgi:hypothetical protein